MSNSRDDDFSTVYVTIAEAADRIGEPAERIRQAVLDQKVDAIKENPQNKRSRWLVRLDDVDELLRSDYGPIVAADATTVALTPNGSDIMTTNRPSYPDPQDQAAAGAGNEEWPSSFVDGTAIMTISRGEELIERLALSIDRFTEVIPDEPFDYQGLLDQYVEATERANAAEVQSAILETRLSHLEDQLQDAIQQVSELRDRNTKLERDLERVAARGAASPPVQTPEESSLKIWRRRTRGSTPPSRGQS